MGGLCNVADVSGAGGRATLRGDSALDTLRA